MRGREAMLALVRRLRPDDGAAPAWEWPFALARELKALPGGGPMVWEPVVLEFCELTGLDPRDAFGRFVTCWYAVRCPAGQDAWDVAARQAEGGPAQMTPDPGTTYALLARTCFHLAVAAK